MTQANIGFKEVIVSAVITRADGTVEDQGVISHFHKNPIKNWYYKQKYLRSIRKREVHG